MRVNALLLVFHYFPVALMLVMVAVMLLGSSTARADDYTQASFGHRIEGTQGSAEIWWCEATWKVAPQHPVPQDASPAAGLSAACNDREAVQVVVRPTKELRQFTVAVGALRGPGEATIPAENIQVLRVYYHFIQFPTEKTGTRDWWPDALPPLTKPLDLPAGKNQPLWVLIHVPKNAKPGDYTGTISLKAEGWSAAVPVKLHVWSFALPERNHVESMVELDEANVFRYHQLKTEADKRRVLDTYYQTFADHRISPLDPVPLDPIQVNFLPNADPPRAEVDFTAFDAAMNRVMNDFHFTNFRLRVQGIGRENPEQGAEVAFSSQMRQLESHLREKGWLKMAYVFWYDEPAPEAYEFVQVGMDRLKKYAPELQTMVTKCRHDDALMQSVDILGLLSKEYRDDEAAKRRTKGQRFWWYVCQEPKSPYCTLFIDHPATDLRVWLWQTWQRDVAGILAWRANYWTSYTAFPKEAQNPFEDPMSYCQYVESPPGTKDHFGNGDGRILYPPLEAASPGTSGDAPVLAPPVSSIRLEMLREGIEDYECLWLLRELIGKNRTSLTPEQAKAYESLLQVPDDITHDMTTVTADPAPIYARRAAIAEAIEQLEK